MLPGWEGSAADGRVLRDAIDWRGDNPSPRCKEEHFNMRHSRARNVIERAFGLLKGRWGILRSPSWYSVKVHNRVISACYLIHNFIHREMEVDPLDSDMEEQVEYQYENIDVVESSEEWSSWRNKLAQRMWNERTNN
ncbi:putative nuclease HARBI1 [Capsicum annuum]|uniref:putative nuclease HARBI1 n=1 Tax=Capsicum annuum TaxID=4072 RepID=UPI001FB09026|nr:putative nuclease HARBI1 [Capsicum annuum]